MKGMMSISLSWTFGYAFSETQSLQYAIDGVRCTADICDLALQYKQNEDPEFRKTLIEKNESRHQECRQLAADFKAAVAAKNKK